MAISLGFGILFATVITLFLIPSLYLILDDFHAWWKDAWSHLLPGRAGRNDRAGMDTGPAIVQHTKDG
jgi:hypothetical protein